MAKIIILMHYMELGGAEMALLGLLYALDPDKVDIDLFIYSHQGELMKEIPGYVNLLPEIKAYSVTEKPIIEAIKKGCYGVTLGRLIAKSLCYKYKKRHPIKGDDAIIYSFLGKYVTPFLPKVNPQIEYDLCISFLLPHNYAITKVRAKEYIAWLHTDYSKMAIHREMEYKIWSQYDYIASISDKVRESFVNLYPSLSNKIIDIENILPKTYILNKSKESIPEGDLIGSPVLLSIGRYTYAKNYDNIPDITRRMVKAGLKDLRWYIIGYGGDEDLIRQKIKEVGMEEHVIMLGKRSNPYPYIKACDIYVQPSRYEGKSVTVREAQILRKPVAITAYNTAPSQINDKTDGVIVTQDNEGCANGLVEFINDKNLQNCIIKHLSSNDFSAQTEVKKIYRLLE